MSNHQRILCLWFPNWAIQRWVISAPEFRRQRVVLFRRDSRRGQVISAVSPLAIQDGVCIGMPISEARSLLRRGGDFHVFEHDLDSDLAAIEMLADSLESFSPVVGLESIGPLAYKAGRRPDSIFLDVTGLAHLFGDENQLARQLMVHCDRIGYLPRVAVADTVGGAWAMARFFAGQYFIEHQQPVVLSPADHAPFEKLPVEASRLPAEMVEVLYQLGIETIGQLQQLPRDDLAMRFGNTIHRRLDQLTGRLAEPVIARHKPAAFVAEQLLEYPTSHRETIGMIIARLVTQLCEQMRSRQQGALAWAIELTCQSGPPIRFCVKLFQPTATTDHVMPLVEMQLEQVLSPHTRKVRKKRWGQQSPGGKNCTVSTAKNREIEMGSQSENESRFYRYTTIQVTEVTVSVTSNVLLVQQQRQLFDESPHLDRQALAQLINRLASRTGSQNVVYPTLQSGAQPEYSFRLKPLVDANRRRRRKPTAPPRQSHVLARPFRLFHPPIRLQSLSLGVGGKGDACGDEGTIPFPPALLCREPGHAASETCVGRPPVNRSAAGSRSCSFSDVSAMPSQKITSSCGPERIETGWWRGVTVCRDYWRIETETDQQFWVYQDLQNGNWFLHGEF